MRRALAVALCVATSGCLGLEIVAPARNAPPAMTLAVLSSFGAEARVHVSGFLARGTDADGLPRALVDSTLVIGGQVVTPFAQGIERDLRYEFDMPIAAVLPETLVVRLPIVTGTDATALDVPLAPRAGPYAFDLMHGEDLLLPIPGDPAPPVSNSSGNWYLAVRTMAASLVSLSSNGVPPDTVALPFEWLKAQPGDTLVITFNRNYERAVQGAPYATRIFQATIAEWRVAVVTATP